MTKQSLRLSLRPGTYLDAARRLCCIGLMLGLSGTPGASGDLRYIITRADAIPGPHTITITTGGAIALTSALPALTQSMTISGPNTVPLVIDGGRHFPIFSIASGATVNLADLSLANGNSTTTNGGAIDNVGTLNILGVTFAGNSAGNGFGGAIYTSGTLNVANSTLANNTAGSGGSIYNKGGTLNLLNDTLSGNQASADGIIVNDQGVGLILNSIISNSTTPDLDRTSNCQGITDGADSLSDGSCPGTLAAVTGLSPDLISNGGPTPTFALEPGSNAIDTAETCVFPPDFVGPLFDPAQPLATDQRRSILTNFC